MIEIGSVRIWPSCTLTCNQLVLGMSGTETPQPHMPLWCAEGQIYL